LSKPVIFSVIESPLHPKLSNMFTEMEWTEVQFPSARKAIKALKQTRPDFIIADFLYSYSTNYDSNHISNLDSLLISLNQYAPTPPKILFLAEKSEFKYIDDLIRQYRQYLGEYAALRFPASPEQVRDALSG